MSTRRLNYTKRVKLDKDNVSVRLHPAETGRPRRFDARLSLPTGLPASARLFVEAYRGSPATRMRFDCGTVAAPRSLEDQELTDFDASMPPPLFRVKVTDVEEKRGRLLAAARAIRPDDPDARPDQRQGLLYIHYAKLNGPVWKLDLENTGWEPTLWLDERVQEDLPRDRRFVALVYPEVLRRVLEHLLLDNGDERADDPDHWGVQWLKMAADLPGMSGEAPPQGDEAGREEQEAWIDRAVGCFARRSDMVSAFAQDGEGE